MRQLVVLAAVTAGALLAGFLIFVGFTRSSLFAGVPILFYRGLILCGLAALLMAALLAFAAKGRPWLDPATIAAATAVSLSFNICFLVLFPVTVDRSISVFLLTQIEQHQGLDSAALQRLFVSRYIGDMRQIDRRIAEQSLSGNIAVANGRISLTGRGRHFLALSRTLARLFGTDARFVGLAPTTAQPPAS